MLATYAYPVVGALPVGEIDTNHVVEILQPIWTEKSECQTAFKRAPKNEEATLNLNLRGHYWMPITPKMECDLRGRH